MAIDDRDLLEVLKFELSFLEKGGYGRSPREPWRAPLVFEDSPTCMNYDSKEQPEPCHIPLTMAGDTLETLYRWGSQNEIEDVYGKWLRTTIHRIEEERERLSGQRAADPRPSANTH